MDILKYTTHRPWEISIQPWIMYQAWKELLFIHWEIEPHEIKHLIPEGLELDTFNGKAWIAVVPFMMRDIKPRYTFPVPWISYFLELNVRTYVKLNNKPGVYFLSLEASNPLAVRIARKLFYLPYMDAKMSIIKRNGYFEYYSKRTHKNEPEAELHLKYKPISDIISYQHNSIEHWLTERYCLYSANEKGHIYIGEIHHKKWELQVAECEIITNTMTLAHGIKTPETKPLLHYSKNLEVVVWYPQLCLNK